MLANAWSSARIYLAIYAAFVVGVILDAIPGIAGPGVALTRAARPSPAARPRRRAPLPLNV